MRKIFFATIVMLLASFTLAACGAFSPTDISTTMQIPVTGVDSLTGELQDQGADVEVLGSVSEPVFDTQSQLISVNGEEVQVFIFQNDSSVAEIANTVNNNASMIDTQSYTWVATPHFYQSGNMIVIYFGDNQEVTQLLEKVLGTQFAGG